MIICRKCSRRHPDGTDFCACGAFLEFDGERAPDEVPTTPTGSVPPPPPTDEARAVTGGPDPAPGPGLGSAEPAPWSGIPGTGNWADPTATTGIEARPPDEPLTVRPTEPVVIQPSGRAGDINCTRCGTRNAPERQFCQHCGQPLAAATAAALSVDSRSGSKVSWWRRLAGRVTGRVQTTDPRQLATQARGLTPGGLSSRSVLFRSGGVMVILFGLLAFLGPWRGTVLNWTKDRVGASRYEVVELAPENLAAEPADAAVTPVAFPLQEVDKLLDRYSNTAWATHWIDITDTGPEEAPVDAACPAPTSTDSFVSITLDEPTDLERIRLQSGRSSDDPTRTAYLRPRLVEVRVNGEECQYVTLAGDGTLEMIDFAQDDVAQLELRVIGVYADPESQPTVEISELVLERRR
jgi:hypothetical protein